MADGDGDGMLAQLLIKQGEMSKEQGTMATDLAVIKERLGAVPDHEMRLRSLERWKYGLPLASLLSLASIALAVYGALHHG